MTSLTDLSKLSGYSKATVSRALSGNGYVSPEARTIIQDLANKLDYTPNAIAQELAAGTTKNIGVVLPYVKHPFFSQILEGILDKSFETGYKIVILPSNYDQNLELQYLEQLRKKAFEALIFTSRKISEETVLKYQKYGPIILCHKPKTKTISASYAEREIGYRDAFKWLKKQNCTNIGFLFSRYKSPTTSVTLQTYSEIYKQPVRTDQIKTGAVSSTDGYDLGAELTQFDSIFANSDDIAANVWRWFEQNKLPKPIIIGQEALIAGQLLNLPTVDNHFLQIGRSAFELAISKEIKQLAIKSEFILQR
ncbi:LacI family DNA-binding transcriptional regulator [Lactococcus cremoris]|uniref:LacI family DNA-binding transcriptional regulator n=1 Tax=Lactococcus lactis subsp. cremoris TaxID=1359 RepID=UPI0003ABC80B|nr:LacI family DNA-binding transcriptional regulator [Lactococcus cremoris]AGV74142.1 transcriptional regulator LacI family [Lactococcus cremoris subsp. cremoris KW2]